MVGALALKSVTMLTEWHSMAVARIAMLSK